ncbi:hypothetical protein Tco_0095894, partial [Tanacetum coccineum]
MTGDKDKLSDFKEYNGGYVAFGNDPKGRTACKIWTLKEDLMLFLKGERNADFHEVIEFLTGCYVNYALLVSPDMALTVLIISDDSSAGKKAESPSPVASERPTSPNDYTPT